VQKKRRGRPFPGRGKKDSKKRRVGGEKNSFGGLGGLSIPEKKKKNLTGENIFTKKKKVGPSGKKRRGETVKKNGGPFKGWVFRGGYEFSIKGSAGKKVVTSIGSDPPKKKS